MRIVSLAPAITEILYALHADSDLVAVTSFCDWPPAVQQKTRLKVTPDVDELDLISLQPDLILSSVFLPPALDGWTGPGQHHHWSPRNLWEIGESFVEIGDLVGRSSEGQKLKEAFIRDLDSLATPAEPRLSVYMEDWFDPPEAAGYWVPELVAIAGGREVLVNINEPSKHFTLPEIEVANPDMIICHWQGWGQRTNPDYLLSRDGWSDLKAIQNQAVHFVDDALLNRPGPRLILGARELKNLFKKSVVS
jgi:iron complex transport system substrate-binding protein